MSLSVTNYVGQTSKVITHTFVVRPAPIPTLRWGGVAANAKEGVLTVYTSDQGSLDLYVAARVPGCSTQVNNRLKFAWDVTADVTEGSTTNVLKIPRADIPIGTQINLYTL